MLKPFSKKKAAKKQQEKDQEAQKLKRQKIEKVRSEIDQELTFQVAFNLETGVWDNVSQSSNFHLLKYYKAESGFKFKTGERGELQLSRYVDTAPGDLVAIGDYFLNVNDLPQTVAERYQVYQDANLELYEFEDKLDDFHGIAADFTKQNPKSVSRAKEVNDLITSIEQDAKNWKITFTLVKEVDKFDVLKVWTEENLD